MAEFINTADIIGDDEMCDQIIMRTVTEYKENRISEVGQYAFYGCTALTMVDVPNVTSIAANSFEGCSALTALILRSATVCTMANTNALTNSAIASGTGYIYVPRNLVDSYKSQTNFSTYAEQIRAIEDYTKDGTVDGSFNWCTGVELDKTSLTFDEQKTQTLTATMLTPSPHGFDEVKWSSGDESIAVVNNGVVTPMGKGTTTITASCNGYSATCEVVVNAEGMNVLAGVAFNAGYISNNGSITAGGASDVYTDKFSILPLVGHALTITLLDAKSTATNSRIVYYNDNGAVKGYTQGSSIGTDGIVITSTVPSDATLAAISINKSNGFSGIRIALGGAIVGLLSYTA